MTEDQEPPAEPEEPQPSPPTPAPDQAAEAAKWKEMARRHEKEAKEGRAARERLAEIENANKSELERMNETARSWQAKAEASELRALRAEVAARKGLNASQAKRLQGTSEEELLADADELLAAFRPADNGGQGLHPADRRPNSEPRLRPGAVPGAGGVETDPRKLADQIRRSF